MSLHLETPALDEPWPVASEQSPLYPVNCWVSGPMVELTVPPCGMNTELPVAESGFSQAQPYTGGSPPACVGFSDWLPGRLRKLALSQASAPVSGNSLHSKAFFPRGRCQAGSASVSGKTPGHSAGFFSASTGRPKWSGPQDIQQGPLATTMKQTHTSSSSTLTGVQLCLTEVEQAQLASVLPGKS